MGTMGCQSTDDLRSDAAPELLVEEANIDLDQIVKDLSGSIIILRLHFIAQHCASLRSEAFQLALREAKESANVTAYKAICKDFMKFKPEGFVVDKDWMDSTNAWIAQKLDRLETDLQNYRFNSFHDCVRRGYREIGQFYLERGQYSDALRMFIRMREHCTLPKHHLRLCRYVAVTSLLLGDWSNAAAYAHKASDWTADGQADSNDLEGGALITQLTCCAALADLELGKYKSAAKGFTQMNVDQFSFPALMSPLHVCLYGGLCALATYDRSDLQQLFHKSQFRQFLELKPCMREAIANYLNSKYSNLLACLEDVENTFLLDVFLSAHTSKLYGLVRERAFIQFFLPYKCVSLNRMSAAFQDDAEKLEREVAELIGKGKINARIDFQKKMIYARDVDARKQAFQSVLKIGKEIEERTGAIVLQKLLHSS